MDRQRSRSGSASSGSSFPSPIRPSNEPVKETPPPSPWEGDSNDGELSNREIGDVAPAPPSTMPAELVTRAHSPTDFPRPATQPEPLNRKKKHGKAKRRHSVSSNGNGDNAEDAYKQDIPPTSQVVEMSSQKKKKKRQRRDLSERATASDGGGVDHGLETYDELALSANPGTEADHEFEGDVFTQQDEPVKKSKKTKHGHRHSQQVDRIEEENAESQSLPQDDDASQAKKSRSERKEEKRRARELQSVRSSDPIHDNGLAGSQIDAAPSGEKPRKKKIKKVASEQTVNQNSESEGNIPEVIRGFKTGPEGPGAPDDGSFRPEGEGYADNVATDESPALARQKRRSSKGLLKEIADKRVSESHAREIDQSPRPEDSEDENFQGHVNGVSAAHDGQVISPPPTNNGLLPALRTGQTKRRKGHSKTTTATNDQEPQQSKASAGSPGFLESTQPLSTTQATSSTTPGSQRRSRRKSKTPFFERGENGTTQLPATREPFASASISKAGASPKPDKVERQKPVKNRAIPENVTDDDERNSKKTPGRKQKEKPTYQSGPLTLAEQAQVRSAVESVRENAGLSQSEIIQVIHTNPQRQKNELSDQLWSAVVEACPTRPRQKLIIWCRQHFHNFVSRGTWTAEQDEELRQMVEIHGKKWSVIGGLINRHQKDVRDRFRNYLICGDTVKNNRWSSEEEDRFFHVVEKAIDAIRKDRANVDADNKSVEDLINWGQISESMGFERTRLQCLDKWNRLRATGAIPNRITVKLPMGQSSRLAKARKDLQKMTGDEKYRLARGIRDSDAKTEPDIPWEDIATTVFDGKFQRQTLVVAWGRLCETVPDWSAKSVAECADYVVDRYEEDGDFLKDDRTTASRSREPTAEVGTPSVRGRIKRLRATQLASPKRASRSKAIVDPEDDMSEDEEGMQLSALLIPGSTRSRGRAVFEEVDESVHGDVDGQHEGEPELGDARDQAADSHGEEDEETNTRHPMRPRAPSFDLGADADTEPPSVTVRQTKTQDGRAKKPKGRDKEARRSTNGVRPLEETAANSSATTATSSPKKRKASQSIPEGTIDREEPDFSSPRAVGESTAKKRRLHENPKTYTSSARKALKRISIQSPRKRRFSKSSDIGDTVEDEEHASPRKRRQSSSAKGLKRVIGRHLGGANSSSDQEEQPPPSSQPRESDLSSSNIDEDMSDIPDHNRDTI